MKDHKATQYFVKLHIIAGQMSTECMNNTDAFYTLTGRSGEIFSGDKVRLLWWSLPERSCPRVRAQGWRSLWRPSLRGKKWRAAPGRPGQRGTATERGLEGARFCSGLNSFSRQPSFTSRREGEGLSQPVPWKYPHKARSALFLWKEMDDVCFRLLQFTRPLLRGTPPFLMPLALFCFLNKTILPPFHK